MDALWNDDFHHSAMVAVTGRNEAYYTDHLGTPQEFISAAKWGYLFQGQRYKWQKKRRGTPALDLPPTAFVNFIQNHDQIANSGIGLRVCEHHAAPASCKAMTALLLLMPQTPMLFQGQEFAASSAVLLLRRSRRRAGEAGLQGPGEGDEPVPEPRDAGGGRRRWPNPCSEETFRRCKIDHAERERGHHARMWALHRDLLKLRREEPAFRRVQRRGDIDGAVLGATAFVLRYFGEDGDDRLLIVNFGIDLPLDDRPRAAARPAARDKRWAVADGPAKTRSTAAPARRRRRPSRKAGFCPAAVR